MSKRRKRQYYDYYVLKNGKKIDTIDIAVDEVIDGSNYSTYYMLGDKLYCIIKYQELDDYYCDIGAITHTEAIRLCLGKVALFTNDKKEFEEFKIKEN